MTVFVKEIMTERAFKLTFPIFKILKSFVQIVANQIPKILNLGMLTRVEPELHISR